MHACTRIHVYMSACMCVLFNHIKNVSTVKPNLKHINLCTSPIEFYLLTMKYSVKHSVKDEIRLYAYPVDKLCLTERSKNCQRRTDCSEKGRQRGRNDGFPVEKTKQGELTR